MRTRYPYVSHELPRMRGTRRFCGASGTNVRGNSRPGPNITVTQGNQLRNKLSFYRILNPRPASGGAWSFSGRSLPSSREGKLGAIVRDAVLSRERANRTTDGLFRRTACNILICAAAFSKLHRYRLHVIQRERISRANDYISVAIGVRKYATKARDGGDRRSSLHSRDDILF